MEAVFTDGKVSRGVLSHRAAEHTAASISKPRQRGERAENVAAARIEVPLRSQLHVLGTIRCVAALAQLTAIVALAFGFGVGLPMFASFATLGGLLVLTALLMARLSNPRPVTRNEYFAHLMCDVIWLSAALYFTGGSATNPFADLYIIYLGLAARALRWRHVLVILSTTIVAYGFLIPNHVDLDLSNSAFNPADLDNWAHMSHFVLVSWIVAYFGFRLSWAARHYFAVAAAARERETRSEAAINLASLAAGAAHEVGTPLTTMAVLIGDMRKGNLSEEEVRVNLDVIWDAIQACKRSLGDMVSVVGADRLREERRQIAAEFVAETIERFKPMRPRVPITLHATCGAPSVLLTGATLQQSLLCLISNAADASPSGVEVAVSCDAGYVQIDVFDRGPGIAPDIKARLGDAFVSTKGSGGGTGVGIFLADLNLARMGGTLTFLEREGGGTCARVTLPDYGTR